MKSNLAFTPNDIPSQQGRRILITGANSGIGYEAALELARRGAEILLPARSLAKADDAIARIRREVPNAKLTPGILDLASLVSIRTFAGFIAANFPGQSLDLLINNAGVMAVPQRELTVDGYERQFATDWLVNRYRNTRASGAWVASPQMNGSEQGTGRTAVFARPRRATTSAPAAGSRHRRTVRAVTAATAVTGYRQWAYAWSASSRGGNVW